MKLCTYEDWNKTQHDSNFLLIFFTITVFVLLAFTIIVGNSLVIIEVLMNKTLRATTKTLILSLAIVNLMDGITVLPFSAINKVLEGYWIFGDLWCLTNTTMYIWLCTVSIYHIIALNIDRLIAITKPLHYPALVTPDRTYMTIAAIWMGSFLLCSPIFLLPNTDKSVSDQCRCIPVYGGKIYIIVSATLTFYVPMVIITFISARIYKTTKLVVTRTSFSDAATSFDKVQSKKKLRYIQYKVLRNDVQIGMKKIEIDQLKTERSRNITRCSYTDPNIHSTLTKLSGLKHTASEPRDMELKINEQRPGREYDANAQFDILTPEDHYDSPILQISTDLAKTKFHGTSDKKQNSYYKTAQRVAMENCCVIFSRIFFSILYGFSLNASPHVWSISSCMSHFNSALNPIIYFFFNRNFRNYLNVLCTCFTDSRISNTEN